MSKINILRKTIALGALSVAALTFVACGGNNGSVAGTWETEDGHKVVFESDGKIADTDGKMTYKVSGNNITFYMDNNGENIEATGTISGDAITMTGFDGRTVHMYKR